MKSGRAGRRNKSFTKLNNLFDKSKSSSSFNKLLAKLKKLQDELVVDVFYFCIIFWNFHEFSLLNKFKVLLMLSAFVPDFLVLYSQAPPSAWSIASSCALTSAGTDFPFVSDSDWLSFFQ